MARKSWYDPTLTDSVRVVKEAPSYSSIRRRHPRVAPGLFECLIYPLSDGPGVAMLIFMPLVLTFVTLPIFDIIAILQPLGLLALPILLPLIAVFSLVFGYALLFFGHMFVASALGEPDHPGWPEWDPPAITEGLGRWVWASIFGLALGGFPIVVYWQYCGDIDGFDLSIFGELAVLGVGYGMMALAASLLHDNIAMANPFTVLSAIVQTGWDYVQPCIVGGTAFLLATGSIYVVLFQIPDIKLAVAGLWAFWVFALYEFMVVLRMVGLTYHAHGEEIQWFHGRPKWGIPARFGRLYTNS